MRSGASLLFVAVAAVGLGLSGCRTRLLGERSSDGGTVLDLAMDDADVGDSGVPPRCGDGIVDPQNGSSPAEECDDGNTDNNDACLDTCKLARCGDGIVHAGVEACDDGNAIDTDGCKSNCALPSCGDGIVQPPEQCDDVNSDDTDGCLHTCLLATCGDGYLHAGIEQCDDGNVSNNDSCVACQPARCGDGFVFIGKELCDDGNTVDDDDCDNSCKPPVCGDGKRAGGEQCDLGPANGNRPAFLITQTTGLAIGTNPLIEDKSSALFYDYYSASSHTGFEAVGESRIYLYADASSGRLSLILTHGIDYDSTHQVQPSSVVAMSIAGLPTGFNIDLSDDAGEFFATSTTTAAGKWSFNGNSDGGILGGLPFPGVWSITVTPTFQAGINTWGWVKDDLTRIPLDMSKPITIQAFDQTTACRTDCTIPRCGDGILDGGEVCDDGNNKDGDGCAANCKSLR